MNYKRSKPKDKKTIEWGSPKEYQDKIDHTSPAKPPKSRAKWCKKLKGPHDFEWKKTSSYEWVTLLVGRPETRQRTIHEWELHVCRACGKQKHKSLPERIIPLTNKRLAGYTPFRNLPRL